MSLSLSEEKVKTSFIIMTVEEDGFVQGLGDTGKLKKLQKFHFKN
jgi:hypothetical protein